MVITVTFITVTIMTLMEMCVDLNQKIRYIIYTKLMKIVLTEASVDLSFNTLYDLKACKVVKKLEEI